MVEARRLLIPWVAPVLLVASTMAAAASGWIFEESEEAPERTRYAIRHTQASGSATLALYRQDWEQYDDAVFVRADVIFDDEITADLARRHDKWARAVARWTVGDEPAWTQEGKWGDGKLSFLLSASRYAAMVAGTRVTFEASIGSKKGKLEADFQLNGLEEAFAQVASRLGAVEERTKPLLAGVLGVTNPRLIESSKVDPRYPKKGRYGRAGGQVILQVVIGTDGTVGNIEVIRVSTPEMGFEESARDAVRHWRYTPATFDDRPVLVYFTVVVDFSMR